MTHVRVCPDCGEEFRPEIVRCSDCGATLVDRYGDEAGVRPRDQAPSEPEPADDDALGDYALVFSSTGSEAMRDAADALVAAGIAFRVAGSSAAFDLYAHTEDYATALQALPGREGAVTPTPETERHEGQGTRTCPACGTMLAAGDVECPECQLGLGEADPRQTGADRDET
jgi:hypothetical protein